MKRRPWTAAEEAALLRLYPDTLTSDIARQLGRPREHIYSKALRLGLRKSAAFLASTASGRLRPGSAIGLDGRFKKGLVPHNKGVKGWDAGGRSRATQFKKGQTPHTWVPIFTEVVDADGYLRVKLTDNGNRFDWHFVHVLLWEDAHGPIPTGHVVVFKNNDRSRVVLDNLECISRQELCRRNSIHRYPPELRQVIRLAGKLKRTIEAHK